MTTLISFLGKGRIAEGQRGYDKTTYRFQDGTTDTTAYFGLALARRLRPSKFIILGTSASIWDVFATDEVGNDEFRFSELAELGLDVAVSEERVDQPMLDRLSAILAPGFDASVHLALIRYARSQEEQFGILATLAELIGEGEEVVLDVTHGFRHLPMLALVAARYLKAVRQVHVGEIYYGAYEMAGRDEAKPVLRLSGLLSLLDWVDALASFDKDGDYGVFSRLLPDELATAATALSQASFFERINDVAQARAPVREARTALRNTAVPGPVALFRDPLLARMNWAEGGRYFERQFTLARFHLRKRDYLRAALLGCEAALTRLVQQEPGQLDPQNYNIREQIRSRFLEDIRRLGSKNRSPEETAFLDLSALRNALAHGTRSGRSEIQQVLRDADQLHAFIASKLDLLQS